MGKQNSIDKIASKLQLKENLTGFQLILGKFGKLGTELNINMCLNIDRKNLSNIDFNEEKLEKLIYSEIFGKKFSFWQDYSIPVSKIPELQRQFRDMGYEVEESHQFNSSWFWFRVHCKSHEISNHVEIIKQKLDLSKFND